MTARATILRERLPDNYDPEQSYHWIVELDQRLELSNRIEIFRWYRNNIPEPFGDNMIVCGTLIGFAKHDDAMLFYLAHR